MWFLSVDCRLLFLADLQQQYLHTFLTREKWLEHAVFFFANVLRSTYVSIELQFMYLFQFVPAKEEASKINMWSVILVDHAYGLCFFVHDDVKGTTETSSQDIVYIWSTIYNITYIYILFVIVYICIFIVEYCIYLELEPNNTSFLRGLKRLNFLMPEESSKVTGLRGPKIGMLQFPRLPIMTRIIMYVYIYIYHGPPPNLHV